MNEIFSNTKEIIEKNKSNIYLSEASTTSLINGILYANGWNVFDPSEVEPQLSIDDKIPDLTLKLFGTRKIYIEIKKIQKRLNKKDVDQLKGYLRHTPDVKLGFLTNSRTWLFFSSSRNENNDIILDIEDRIDIISANEAKILKFFSNHLAKEKMIDELYNTNIEILFDKNSHSNQKNAAIYNLRKIKDKKVLDTLESIFYNEKEDTIRLNALNGLVEMSKEKNPEPILKKALNDQSVIIKEKAKENLEVLKIHQERKIHQYKSKLGI